MARKFFIYITNTINKRSMSMANGITGNQTVDFNQLLEQAKEKTRRKTSTRSAVSIIYFW